MCTGCLLESVGQTSMHLKELICNMKLNPLLNKLAENSNIAYYYGLARIHGQVVDPKFAGDVTKIFGTGPGSVVNAGAVCSILSNFMINSRGYAPATVIIQLTALRSYWKTNSVVLEHTEGMTRAVNELKVRQKKAGGSPKKKDPISMSLFKAFILLLTDWIELFKDDKPKLFRLLRDRAMFLMTYFLFMRRKEAWALKNKDVQRITHYNHQEKRRGRILNVTISESKTDPGPVDMCINDKLECDLPVVDMIWEYMKVRKHLGNDDAFFQSQQNEASYSYGFKAPQQLNQLWTYWVNEWKKLCPNIGRRFENLQFHSMRKGGMNRLLEMVQDIEIVAGHGRWKCVETIRNHYQKRQVAFRLKATQYM